MEVEAVMKREEGWSTPWTPATSQGRNQRSISKRDLPSSNLVKLEHRSWITWWCQLLVWTNLTREVAFQISFKEVGHTTLNKRKFSWAKETLSIPRTSTVVLRETNLEQWCNWEILTQHMLQARLELNLINLKTRAKLCHIRKTGHKYLIITTRVWKMLIKMATL